MILEIEEVTTNDTKVKDPVCGMIVDEHGIKTAYEENHYAFCSRQCLERFLANPGIYIGQSGQKSLKQYGAEVIKCRRLRLAHPLSVEGREIVRAELCSMMGVKSVEFDDAKLRIIYDLIQVTAEQIEAKLGGIGVKLGAGWAERLRRAFAEFEEETEIADLEIANKFHQAE